MSSLQAALRKSPLAVSIYLKLRGLTNARQPHPVAEPSPPLTEESIHSSVQAAQGQERRIAAVETEGSATWKTSDFDIYHQYPPHVFYTFSDRDALFRDAVTTYSNVSVEDEPSGLYTDPNRVLQFFQLISAANRLSEGDYVEFGSHRGFSTRVIHRFMDPSRTLYAFDTFEGFDERDVVVEKNRYDSPWGAGSFAPTSVERVAKYVGDGEWPTNLKLVKGWFPDSYRGMESQRWRFVHIDFDLFAPIKAALENSWEQVLPGGVVLVHDYGCYGFPGARAAVDEFSEKVGVPATELVDRWSSAVIRKPLR
jgi:macrocin-O-methyltransferase TylF-like protien